jgi:predicted flap endonuclease-1-like 5' DNA nuclease
MPARERLTPTEQKLAYLIGGGIVLAMLAALLGGLGTIEDKNVITSLLLIGLAAAVLGIGAWLYLIRPWERFDDLKTPAYTGHEEQAPAAAPPKVETPAAAAARPAVAAKPARAGAPAAAAQPEAPARPDDLTLIEGIGPKSAAALAEAGIRTFAQVAALSAEELEAAIRTRGVRLVGHATMWPVQAGLAAAGELDALKDLQKHIKGGVRYDDLTQVEGVGAQSVAALYQAGIRTYQELAQSTPDALHALLNAAGLKSVKPDSWPEQAALIVRGDLTGLKALQDRLRGGR